jgi:hypothetical protein
LQRPVDASPVVLDHSQEWVYEFIRMCDIVSTVDNSWLCR